MSKRIDSATLRQIAEDIYDKIAPEAGFDCDERDDLVTSIVRQWLTYEGHASLFPDDEREIRLLFTRTPLEMFNVDVKHVKSDWTSFINDWNIDPNDIPQAIARLNRGQSAQITNLGGVELRIYVDPLIGKRAIEQVDKEKVKRPDGVKRSLAKIAADMVRQQLGNSLSPTMKDGLIRSIVMQWQQFDGHACIFVDDCHQLTLEITEHDDGGCNVTAKQFVHDVRPVLTGIGIESRDLCDVLTQINLGEEVPFQDRQGASSFLGHNPRTKQFVVRTPGGKQP